MTNSIGNPGMCLVVFAPIDSPNVIVSADRQQVKKILWEKQCHLNPQHSSMKPNDLSQARLDKVNRLGRRHQSFLWLLGCRMFFFFFPSLLSSAAVRSKHLEKSSSSLALGDRTVSCRCAHIYDGCTESITSVDETCYLIIVSVNQTVISEENTNHLEANVCATRISHTCKKPLKELGSNDKDVHCPFAARTSKENDS